MILSTLLVCEMDYLCDEVIIIKDGRILLQEAYDDLLSHGVTVTGSKQDVDTFAEGKEVLNEEQLGGTRAITLYGVIIEADLASATELGFDNCSVSIHSHYMMITK